MITSLNLQYYPVFTVKCLQDTPLEVTVQAGEFEVVKSIFQSSIPYLLGWSALMDLSTAAGISRAMSGGNGRPY